MFHPVQLSIERDGDGARDERLHGQRDGARVTRRERDRGAVLHQRVIRPTAAAADAGLWRER